MLAETDKRAIGQHFVCGFEGYEVNDAVRVLITKYYVGSIIIFKRNIESITQLHNLILDLQLLAKDAGHTQPLLIGIDQENGQASAFSSTTRVEAGTQFPGGMAMASTGDPQLAKEVASASGREMQAVGINWVYSPVADVNSDPLNPVIGIRAYGEDSSKAANFVCAVAEGLESAGLAACAKHFPGHGDTKVDSHLALPVIEKDLATMEQIELVPFKAAINKNIASVMSGHMVVPPLVKMLGSDDDENVPASLSKSVNTKLLRDKLGFKGVCVTDCFEMKAISDTWGFSAASVMSLSGGVDIVMICHVLEHQVQGIEGVYKAIESGGLTMDFLENSRSRIRDLKTKVCGSWQGVLENLWDKRAFTALKKENAILSRLAYARTTQWKRPTNQDDDFFISPEADVLILTPQMESLNQVVDEEDIQMQDGKVRNLAGPSYSAFAAAIAMRAPFSCHVVYTPQDITEDGLVSERVSRALQSIRAVVFTTRNAHQPKGHFQLTLLKAIIGEVAKEGESRESPRLYVVVSCNPYDESMLAVDEVTKNIPCLLTFEFTKPALEEAGAKLYGETLGGG